VLPSLDLFSLRARQFSFLWECGYIQRRLNHSLTSIEVNSLFPAANKQSKCNFLECCNTSDVRNNSTSEAHSKYIQRVPRKTDCLLYLYLTDAVTISKGEVIPVTGRGSPQGCETSRLPHFPRQSAHKWRWVCQPYATVALQPQEDSWYSFLLEAESTPGSQCGWKN
jgi:hypothetical protein